MIDFYTRKRARFLMLALLFFYWLPNVQAQSITSFTLVDATADSDISTLSEGDVINLPDLSTGSINIRADVSQPVGSVSFFINGALERTENVAPYAIGGDNSGNYLNWAPTLGTIEISALAYSGAQATGTVLDTAVVNVTFSNEPGEILVTDLAFINCPTAPLSVGDTIDLDVLITPSNATNQTIAFTASDGTSVDFLSGEFIASAPGVITVTATSFSDGSVSDQCVITIEEPEIIVTDVSFINCPTAPLSVGDTIDLDVLITPSNATNQTIAFTASDGTSVDFLSGEFIASAPGVITVTATSFSDGSVSDQCIITIEEPEILVTDVSFINCPTAPLSIGATVDLDVLITPSNATNQTIAFTASDGTSVDFLSGEFIASAPGTITVTATSFSDGAVSDQCVITIAEPDRFDPYSTIQAEDFSGQNGVQLAGSGNRVGFINNNDFIRFDNVEFGRGPVAGTIMVSSNTNGGTIEFRTGSETGLLIATATVTNTGGWGTFQPFAINVVDPDSYANGTVFLGTEDLFLVFKGGSGFLLDVDEFIFESSDIIVTDLNFINCPTTPLNVGDFIDLDVELIPANAVNQIVAFTASDGLSVDFLSGEFTASAPGQITVTATSFSNGAVSDQCVIDINDTIPPGVPSSLVGTAVSQGIVDLSWTSGVGSATTFEIERSFDAFVTNPTWTILATVPGSQTAFTDSTFTLEEYGLYRVRAVNNVGASDYSNEITVSNIPLPPTNLTASNITTNSFTLSWDEPPYGNDYLVEFTTSLDSGFQFLDALYFGYTDFNYGGFEAGTTYFVRMRTNFDGIPSAWSAILQVDILPDGQSVESLILINADSDQDIGPLQEGDTLNLFYLPTSNLNVRAETNPDSVGSVGFGYNGDPNFSTENMLPYALAGDTQGDYKPWTPALGNNTLTATPYSGANRGGVPGTSATVNFFVVDQDTTTTPPDTTSLPPAKITGELKKWHKVTVSFEGTPTSESDADNPFTNYRLNVTFTNGSKSYTVPGFYAADGNAANTSATSGNIWQVHFSPDEIGTWTYVASFRTGSDIAISTDPLAGTPVQFDGETGSFDILPSDKTGRDFRATGRLEYVGEHYLRFAESGDYFFKVGADAPENTFAYEDFDATPNAGGRRKSWSLHANDFDLSDAGAYTWGGVTADSARANGRALLGAINYLAGEGMNVFSFLTFSLDGDDDNVYPHLQISSGANNWNSVHHDRFDVSKMAQWEQILSYADKKGVYMHFKTQETENDQRMDGGQLGRERKLYYRELIARFGHHLALNWNLGEENDIWQELSDPNNDIVRSYAQYIRDVDPYDHNIVIHTYPGQQDEVYDPLLGATSELTGASVQTGVGNVHRDVKKWVEDSRASGKKWVVANDEQGGANSGVTVDAAYPDNLLPENRGVADNREAVRHQVLWGTLMAGGAGVEYYYGYQTGCDDLDCQDHRTRQTKWDDARQALNFFNTYLQPHAAQMVSADQLTADNQDYVFAQVGTIYAIYRSNGGATNLDLSSQTGTFEVKWYDPRNGGGLQDGTVTTVSGGSSASIGLPPSSTSEDWVALIANQGNNSTSARITEDLSSKSTQITAEDMTYYPNPVRSVLHLNFKAESPAIVIIRDLSGRRLKAISTEGTNAEIDMGTLKSGFYLMEVEQAGKIGTVRIYKE